MNLAPIAERFGAHRRQRAAESTSMRPLMTLLEQVRDLITLMPTPMYLARPAARVSGSVGEHVRHCLDHVAALLAADPAMVLTYDRRQRGTPIEASPEAALQYIFQQQSALERWPGRSLDEPVLVTSMVARDGRTVTGWSTLAREMAFVVSHTIHHHATIRVLLMVQGQDVPERFGHSPSTPARH